MPVNVALLTWNMGNTKPAAPEVSYIAKELLEGSTPDLIVIALQEAKESLAEALEKGPLKGKYAVVAEETATGITKIAEGLSTMRTEVLQKVGTGKITPLTKVSRKGIKLKGATCIAFEYGGFRFGFAGAHLDASKSEKRDAEFKEAVAVLKELKANYLFFMGDLNYRLPVGGKLLNKDITVEQLSALLCNADTRMKLFMEADPLRPGSKTNTHDFIFPIPICYTGKNPEITVPTYKRDTKVKTPRKVDKNGNVPVADFMALHFKGRDGNAPAVSEKRPGEFDLGWLDRVGFSCPSGTSFKEEDSRDLHGTTSSDHAPFLLKGVCK